VGQSVRQLVHSGVVVIMRRRVMGLTLLFSFALCLFLFVAVRSGLLRRHYVTVRSVDRMLSSSHLIGFSQDQVVRFLDSHRIEYHQSEKNGQTSPVADNCAKLTAVLPNSSRGLLNVGDIMITFQFDDNCRLARYDIKEHFTLP
jgi:hypothetical protein